MGFSDVTTLDELAFDYPRELGPCIADLGTILSGMALAKFSEILTCVGSNVIKKFN